MRYFEDSEEEPTAPAQQTLLSETNIRVTTALITLAAAVLNFFGHSQRAIQAIGIASGLVFLWLTISWLRAPVRRLVRWYSDKRYVARELRNLKLLFERLGKFTSKDDGRSFRHQLYYASTNRYDIIDRLLASDYIEDWIMTYAIRLSFPCLSLVEFLVRCREFTTIVNRYNTDYVIRVQKSLEAERMEILPSHCLDRFEEFRERFSAYLNELEQWADAVARDTEGRVSLAHFLQHVPHRSFERVRSFKKNEVAMLVQTNRSAG